MGQSEHGIGINSSLDNWLYYDYTDVWNSVHINSSSKLY